MNASVNWASYEMPVPDPRSGFILNDLGERTSRFQESRDRSKSVSLPENVLQRVSRPGTELFLRFLLDGNGFGNRER